MTLREVFEVWWNITEIHITARDSTLKFLHEWIYAENYRNSIHEYHRMQEGRLAIVDQKINAHGDPTRNGAEMGWGVKEKLFPEQILDAKIVHFTPSVGYSGGDTLYVDIELDPITVEILRKTIKGRELEQEDES